MMHCCGIRVEPPKNGLPGTSIRQIHYKRFFKNLVLSAVTRSVFVMRNFSHHQSGLVGDRFGDGGLLEL